MKLTKHRIYFFSFMGRAIDYAGYPSAFYSTLNTRTSCHIESYTYKFLTVYSYRPATDEL